MSGGAAAEANAGARAKAFLSGDLPGRPGAIVGAVAEVVIGPRVDDDSFRAVAPELGAIVSLLTDRIDEAVLARCPELRVVANVAVGYDNVDLGACRARGIVVTNTPDVLTDATADFTFGLILASARRIAEGDRVSRAGGFTGWTPKFLLGTSVNGKTLGIVGLGRIGQAVARRAQGFGMHVLYTGAHRAPPEVERAANAEHVATDDLFTRADILTLHCPLTPATRQIASRARLFAMKPGAIFVNTARGGCVDEDALADALDHGPLAAAGLDVYEHEPAISEKLLCLRNVVLAPHAASADIETRAKMADLAATNAAAVLTGNPPLTPVRISLGDG